MIRESFSQTRYSSPRRNLALKGGCDAVTVSMMQPTIQANERVTDGTRDLFAIHQFAADATKQPSLSSNFGKTIHVYFVPARTVFQDTFRIASPGAGDLRLRVMNHGLTPGGLRETK